MLRTLRPGEQEAAWAERGGRERGVPRRRANGTVGGNGAGRGWRC